MVEASITDLLLKPIPVTLVTGFPGAGKTTFIDRVINWEYKNDFVAILNESLHLGIKEDGRISLIQLPAGCICCSGSSAFAAFLEQTLRAIDNGRLAKFAHLFIEAPGVANPAPVLRLFLNHPYFQKRFYICAVVTIVDAIYARDALTESSELINQMELADSLVVSKADLASKMGMTRAELENLKRKLAAICPHAKIYEPVTDGVDAEMRAGNRLGRSMISQRDGWQDSFDGTFESYKKFLKTQSGERDRLGEQHLVRMHEFLSKSAIHSKNLSIFIEKVRLTFGPNLLQLRGVLRLLDHPRKRLAVCLIKDRLYAPMQADESTDDQKESRVLVVTREGDPSQIEKIWRGYADLAEVDDRNSFFS